MNKVKYVLLNIILFLSAIFYVTSLGLVGEFIDAITLPNNSIIIKQIILKFVIFFITSFVFNLFSKSQIVNQAYIICAEMEEKLLKYCLYANNDIPIGKSLDIIGKDILYIKNFYQNIIPIFVFSVGLFISSFLSTLSINIVIALVMLIWLIVAIFYLIFYEKKQNDKNIIENKRKAEEVLSMSILEATRLKNMIFYLQKEKFFLDRISYKMEDLKDKTIVEQKLLYKIWIISIAFVKFGQFFLLLIGGMFSIFNFITVGSLYSIYVYFNSFSQSIEHIQILYRGFILYKNSIKRISPMINFRNIVHNEEYTKENINRIKVENFSIKYGDNLILDNISLEFKRGVNLLYGKSGLGKSSLLKVIAFINENFTGKISYLDDKTFKDLTIKDVLYVENMGTVIIPDFGQEMNILNQNNIFDLNDDIKLLIKDIDETNIFEEKNIRIINILRTALSDYQLIIFDETFTNLEENIVKILIEFIDNNCTDKIIIITGHTLYLKTLINYQIDLEELVLNV